MDRPDFVWDGVEKMVRSLTSAEKQKIAEVANVEPGWEDRYVLCKFKGGVFVRVLELRRGVGYYLVPRIGP